MLSIPLPAAAVPRSPGAAEKEPSSMSPSKPFRHTSPRCAAFIRALAVVAALAAASSAPVAAASAGGTSSAAATAAVGSSVPAAAGASVSTIPASPATAPAASGLAPDAYRREIESWRAARDANLRKPESWLTLVGLFWLEEGENRFGSDPRNRVVLPAGKAPAVAGTLVRHGEAVTVRATPGAGLESDGHPVTEMTLASDAKGKPTVLRLGSLSFYVLKRGDRLGVRVKDRQSPALATFHGVESFPVDPEWRMVARFEPHPRPTSIPIANVLGQTENQPSPGTVVFEHAGKTWRLDALDGGDGSLSLIFADSTSGRETYGAGRFLDTDPPRDGKVVVDFNKAYNPPCAFTAFATCPLPPRQNRLAVAVTAGEKKYGEGHH
jgi:uncharacterized protein (DUF1684 family)